MAFTVDDILLEWTDTDPKKGVGVSIDAGLYEGSYTSIDAYLFANPSKELTVSMDVHLMPNYNFANWSRTEVFVPSSAITSELTEFPLLIHPSGSAGTTSADCANLFESMRLPGFSKNDDFSGISDGDPPSTTLWSVVDPGGYLSVQSGALEFDAPAGVSTESYIESKFPVYTDFDVQFDFDVSSYDSTMGSSIELVGIRLWLADNKGYKTCTRAWSSTTDGFIMYGWDCNDDFGGGLWHKTSETEGLTTSKIRFLSFNGILFWAFWYPTNSEWGCATNGTYYPWTTTERPNSPIYGPEDGSEECDQCYGPYTIQIYFKQVSASTTRTTVTIDNVIWNKPGDMNIYNMAVVDDNDDILPVEIVDVETEAGNEEMWMYALVSSISSTVDTRLRIYTTQDDLIRNPFVAHHLSRPSEEVWTNFLTVHNCYSATGDSSPLRNKNDPALIFTSQGSYHRDSGTGFFATGSGTSWPILGSVKLGPFGSSAVYPDTMGEAFTLEFSIEFANLPTVFRCVLGNGWVSGSHYENRNQAGFQIMCDDAGLYLPFSPDGVYIWENYYDWSPVVDTLYSIMLVWEFDEYPIVYVNGSVLTWISGQHMPTIFRPCSTNAYDDWSIMRTETGDEESSQYPPDDTKYSAIRMQPYVQPLVWHTTTYSAQLDTLLSYDVQIRQVGIDAYVENDVDFVQAISAASSTSPIVLDVPFVLDAVVSATSSVDPVTMDRLISLASIGASWGEDTLIGFKLFDSWENWQTSAAGTPEIIGGAYGGVVIPSGESLYSPVLNFGVDTHRIDLRHANVSPYSENYTIHIRGDTSSFGQLDGSPSWEEYIDVVDRTWTYIQVKIAG